MRVPASARVRMGAVRSMTTGEPVIGRRAGVDRVASLTRDRIASRTRERLAAERMIDAYESVYRDLVVPAGIPRELGHPRPEATRRERATDAVVATAG